MNEPLTSNAATLACHISLSSHFVKAMIEVLSTAMIKKNKPKSTHILIMISCEKKKLVPAFMLKQGSMIHSEPDTHFGKVIGYY